MPNPGSPVAATRLATGELLLIMNEAEQGRDTLSIAISADEGVTYQVIHVLDARPADATATPRVGYPSMLQTDDGSFHLLYSWHNRRIKHLHFNLAWLDERR